MEHIYLPIENVSDFKCYYIYNSDTIRAYKKVPQVNSTSDYVDFYINSHYLEKEGSQTWGSYHEYLPTCLATTAITNNYLYRNDLFDILGCFIILAIFCVYFPICLFSKLFKKGSLL